MATDKEGDLISFDTWTVRRIFGSLSGGVIMSQLKPLKKEVLAVFR